VDEKVTQPEKDSTVIEDANVVAFLAMKGYTAIPYIKHEAKEGQSSRVAWDVQGDPEAIELEIKMFWANERVGIRDYIRILKDVRSNMYGIKQVHNQLRKGE